MKGSFRSHRVAFPLISQKSSTTASIRTTLRASDEFASSIVVLGRVTVVLGCDIVLTVTEGGVVGKSMCAYSIKHE
jgi:hypothetical protein